MMSKSISLICCIFLAVVIANVYSKPYLSTGSDLHDKVNCLATNNLKSTTKKGLGGLLDVRDNAMVVVAAGDTCVLVHRAVLTARSPVIAAELQANSSYISIADVEGSVIRQLVALLYIPELPQQLVMSPQLQATAHRLGVSMLKAECWQQAAIPLSVETAAATAVVAVRHSCDSLRQVTVAFIKAHFPQVMASQGWADAVYKWHEEVMEITRMLFDVPVDSSTPATGDCRTSPTTQPPSRHTDHDQTPSTAAPSVTCSGGQTYDSAAISALRSLSAEEKASRLIAAAKHGAVREVAALLCAGAAVGAVDGGRNTALHWAAWEGHLQVASYLLGAGADVGARSSAQRTPLHQAARNGHANIVQLLLAVSADPDVRDGDSQTPLNLAVWKDHIEAAAALIEAGADRRLTNNKGKTALDLARSNKNQKIVDLLS